MIKSIRLQNFFSFEDETIDLNPGVNLLIGINGSGKSNLIKAFAFIRWGNQGKNLIEKIYEWRGFDQVAFYGRKDDSITITLNLCFPYLSDSIKVKESKYVILIEKVDGKLCIEESFHTPLAEDLSHRFLIRSPFSSEIYYQTGYSQDKEDRVIVDSLEDGVLLLSKATPQKDSPIHLLQDLLKNLSYFFDFDTKANSDLRKGHLASGRNRLLQDGRNLPQVLNLLKMTDRSIHKGIIEQLKEVNPKFEEYDFNILASGVIELVLFEKPFSKPISPANISDGTLRYLCILAILMNPNRGTISCIDEPEMGLHPELIINQSKLLKKAGKTTQLLITTHLPTLINHFEVEDLLIFEKNENNATLVKKFKGEDFRGAYDVLRPGDMWVSGDFGGKRYS